ncbi:MULTISPECIES: amidohydrolase [Halomonadaceae]|uniref:amidohydrolase n=1 Tax=Halomonadaceae TaxID=28256 RepID=UPI00159966E1|nr:MULTISPECIES: amidohydrolase [Halomonas]QJQ96314.1 amidohydrolase [Halomonas sp. PA5]
MAELASEFLNDEAAKLIALRRRLHRNPEEGFTEYWTTFQIYEELKHLPFDFHFGKEVLISDARMGVPPDELLQENEARALEQGVPEDFLAPMRGGHTGLIAQLDTHREGPHFAFRFDIDALPIIESQQESHLPYREGFSSTRKGVMHSCGHDGHATIGVGLARYLAAHRERLKGTYTIIFQPAEEGGRGAKAIVEKGWLDSVDYFMSGHLGIVDAEEGVIGATSHGFLASSKLNVEYHGKSAHSGLEPNEGKNALLAAASATLHLHGIARHKGGATRVNVGKLEAGTGRNIIADHARMLIETRGQTTALDDYMQQEAKRMLQASADLHDVKVDIQFVGRAIEATSDEIWNDIVKAATARASRVKDVRTYLPLGASEDVTYMMRRVQEQGGVATFMIFASPLPAGHHHPQFDISEASILAGIETIISTVDYLNEGNESRS